ncbi:hypothetical protein T265_07006 [Opisthorchis viverrini]|uniref:very-long-chain (3R)-3-hydroxyacyl-CoA dehydratase n=1 Tax=Opisthorchis viverrini TaxID=6198 RepID=A0A074ZIC1_OPIVI|nr:hypothetical protein T265_07006 [Opisthorchis viverrini]KER25547.1 hypothetical protein T265_07006 [Opisthorchis viverrini]
MFCSVYNRAQLGSRSPHPGRRVAPTAPKPFVLSFMPLCQLKGKLIVRALPWLAKSRRFSYSMPNALNMAFDFPLFLHTYLVGMTAVFYFLMRYMYGQRRRVLGPRPRVGADQMGFFSYIPFLRSMVGSKSSASPKPRFSTGSESGTDNSRVIEVYESTSRMPSIGTAEKCRSHSPLAVVVNDGRTTISLKAEHSAFVFTLNSLDRRWVLHSLVDIKRRFTGLRNQQSNDATDIWYSKDLFCLVVSPQPARCRPLVCMKQAQLKPTWIIVFLYPPSVHSCHATRRKHEDEETARLSKPRQGKSRCIGRVRTTDLPVGKFEL